MLGMVGAGFWARFQLAAWREVPGVRVAALCDTESARAERLASDLDVGAVYADPAAMLAAERLDAVDIVTPEHTHRPLAELALGEGVAAITQKPMAPSLADAEAMVAAAERAGRPLLVHENFRWQAPLRALKERLDGDAVGRPFRARLVFSCSFPVFDNQPALRESERFIVLDLGIHLLDVARFLLGEVERVYCRTARVSPGIRGEDVATVVLTHASGATTIVELSYASRLAGESFPETFVTIEAERGSLELDRGHVIRTTTAQGTEESSHAPPVPDWAEPEYALVQSAIVPCQAHLAAALRGQVEAETDARDNLRTLSLVFAAYESAERGEAVAG